ncbi:hypothetical protein ACFLTC_03270 [Chloroflexota bacterium]
MKRLFATEELRKATREAAVRFRNGQSSVPEKQSGWAVWVANSTGPHVEVRAGNRLIGLF